jgi:hypothetical protein
MARAFSRAKSRVSHAYNPALFLHHNEANNSLVSQTYRHRSPKSSRLHTYRKQGKGPLPRRIRLRRALFSLCAKERNVISILFHQFHTLYQYRQIYGGAPLPLRKTSGLSSTDLNHANEPTVHRAKLHYGLDLSFAGSRGTNQGSLHFVTSYLNSPAPRNLIRERIIIWRREPEPLYLHGCILALAWISGG